jgi:NAD(P)-dependent dehydrogenase (short-subunit alcohol dehydrogenase family)
MRKILITGCSSGFGLLTALQFARNGDHVIATMRDVAKSGALTRAAERERLSIEIVRLDVTDQSTIDAAHAAIGPVDVLVNNAGIELRSSIEDADEEDVRRQFDTNVFGTLRMIRTWLPAMRERRAGTIVNLSSVAGLVARPFGGLYSASKHAIEAITEALHFEVRAFGIRVVLIEPGQYGTSLLDNAFTGRRFTPASPYWETSAHFDDRLARLLPAGAKADPQEVAALIQEAVDAPEPRLRHVAGDDAKMITTAYKQMDFEAYEQAMRQSLDWHD